jgi:hypothetical protein
VADCLLLTTDADEFAEEIERHADFPLRIIASRSPDQALAEYRGQSVVLGEPGMIAAVLENMPEVEWVQSTWAGVTPLIGIPVSPRAQGSRTRTGSAQT